MICQSSFLQFKGEERGGEGEDADTLRGKTSDKMIKNPRGFTSLKRGE
jgi:hypothetical protein